MKSFKYIFFLIMIALYFQIKIEANEPVITFFIKKQEAPVKKDYKYDTAKVSKPLYQPSFIFAVEQDKSWLHQPGFEGLYASYLGYLGLSDKNGQVSFPREQQNDTIYLLITPQVEPEFMISPTLIHHWITKHNSPAHFYKINRKHNKELKVYYFDIRKMNVPQDIPFNTITLYAHPDEIEVPVGISLNTYSTNLILPELQAKKINSVKNSLYTLSIKQYFEQIIRETKNNIQTISSMIVNQ